MTHDTYKVKPVYKPVDLKIEVPGSKSITNRALLMASMAKGKSTLHQVLFSSDSRYCIQSLKDLGYIVDTDEDRKIVSIVGGDPVNHSRVHVGSAGTTARFLTAILASTKGEFTIDASEQMRTRPMKPLLDILSGLGTEIQYLGETGHLPVHIKSGNLNGGEIEVQSDTSSQFISALLISGCQYTNGLILHVEGKRASGSYVHITTKMMKDFGVDCTFHNKQYIVEPNQQYKNVDYTIEPDISSACYFYAMAALTGGSTVVKGVFKTSIQGDIKFLDVLTQLGCSLEETIEGIKISGPADGKYPGIDIDMNDFSDQTMTMAALAIYAQSPTRIRNIQHIKHQESNRIMAILTELKRMGIHCEETDDGMIIYPGKPKPAIINTYEDHRMAMAFSLVGLRTGGIIINNPSCCSKTFEDYFEMLDKITKA